MDASSIAIIVVAVFLFVVMIVIYGTVFKPKFSSKKKDKPVASEPKKSDNPPSPEASSDDIPPILKEVTRHNYMRERALSNTKTHEFEIEDIKETKENLSPKQVHRIEPIPENDDFDGDSGEETFVEEFSKLSNRMKTVIISDALKPKDDEK